MVIDYRMNHVDEKFASREYLTGVYIMTFWDNGDIWFEGMGKEYSYLFNGGSELTGVIHYYPDGRKLISNPNLWV